MDRRRFLGVLGGATLASGLRRPARAASFHHLRPTMLEAIGLQLYTVRGLMARDFEGTLERVAAIGYREVEFAGYFDRSPDAIRATLDRHRLAAPAAHVSLEAVRDDWERTLDAARRIGHRYLVVPWLPAESRRTLDDYRRIADLFNRVGERATRAGVRLGYHNHAFEFQPIDGTVPYDALAGGTDPEHVALELDLFWLVTGGGDPFDYFARFPGRFELVHVKDMDDTSERAMTDPGRGIIDFPGIVERAPEAGIRHWFVEHDRPADPLRTARVGYEYLRTLET